MPVPGNEPAPAEVVADQLRRINRQLRARSQADWTWLSRHSAPATALRGSRRTPLAPSPSSSAQSSNVLARVATVLILTVGADRVIHGDLTIKSLRDDIAVVLQETFLFSGTIRDNIAYGRLGASDEEITTAAKDAYAHDFIMKLPGGYNWQVGEGGAMLSRGQRQRISLARTILRDPRILILDEATSDVDTETEMYIQRALDRVMRGRTTFVIAHRLSTVRNADQIIVLDHGVIVERGTHEELLARGGDYHQLYEIQFADVAERRVADSAGAGPT